MFGYDVKGLLGRKVALKVVVRLVPKASRCPVTLVFSAGYRVGGAPETVTASQL